MDINSYNESNTDDDGPIKRALLQLNGPCNTQKKKVSKKHTKHHKNKTPSLQSQDDDVLSSSTLSPSSSSSSTSSSSSQEIRGMDNETISTRIAAEKRRNNSPKSSGKSSSKDKVDPLPGYVKLVEMAGIKEDIDVDTSCSDLSDDGGDDDDDEGLKFNGSYTDNPPIRRLELGSHGQSNKSLDLLLDIDALLEIPEDNYNRKKRKNPEDIPSRLRCFGCKFGSVTDPTMNGKCMNELISIFKENYFMMDNLILARICHTYFKKMIWKPMKLKKKDMWRTREILNHFTNHIEDPCIFLGETIRKYKRVSEALEQMLGRKVTLEDGSKTVFADHKNIKTMLEVDKFRLLLRSRKPDQMIGHNPNFAIDFSQQKFVNIHKNWSID